MTFLKGFGLAILSLLLFLSLSFFGVGLTIDQTLLNPDFAVSQVDRLDIAPLAKDMLSQQQVPPELEQLVGALIDNTIADLRPWIKEQARYVTSSFYDYLEGRSQSLNPVISLEPVKNALRYNLREAVLQSIPPQFAGIPLDLIERYLNEYYQLISQEIPSTFDFGGVLQDPAVIAELEQIKQAVGYFHTGYYALIGFILLLIVGIVLIHREVRGSTRSLGATLLSCGIFSLVGAFIARDVIATQLAQLDIPFYLQTWIPQLIKDALAPLEIYGIGLMATGVALLVVSFVYKPKEPSL